MKSAILFLLGTLVHTMCYFKNIPDVHVCAYKPRLVILVLQNPHTYIFTQPFSKLIHAYLHFYSAGVWHHYGTPIEKPLYNRKDYRISHIQLMYVSIEPFHL